MALVALVASVAFMAVTTTLVDWHCVPNIHICMYAYVRVCVCVYIFILAYIYTHIYAHKYYSFLLWHPTQLCCFICISLSMCIYTYVYIYICTCNHMYIYIYIYTYTYIYMWIFRELGCQVDTVLVVWVSVQVYVCAGGIGVRVCVCANGVSRVWHNVIHRCKHS